MISLRRYETGTKVADGLVRSPDDLVKCFQRLLEHFDNNPDLIVDVHSEALNNEACKNLRKLGTILSNMQGD